MMQQKTYTVLDVGFGGGDIPIYLSTLAREKGIDLHITAIEIDERALEFVQQLPPQPRVQFRQASLETILEEGQKFDFVISNHVLHHLSENQLSHFLDQACSLATSAVCFNDIRRSDIGFLLFGIASQVFRHSFVSEDGLMSIRRSFTKKELENITSNGWRTERFGAFRLLLTHLHEH